MTSFLSFMVVTVPRPTRGSAKSGADYVGQSAFPRDCRTGGRYASVVRCMASPGTTRSLTLLVAASAALKIWSSLREPLGPFHSSVHVGGCAASGGPLAINGRSGGARTRTSIAHRRTTGDHEELRVSRSGFPTIRSPVDGSRCIRVTAYRKLGYQTGRCRMTGKAVRLLYLGPFPSAHLLALSFFSRCSSRSPRSPPRCFVGCGCLSVLHHGA